jgi:hypothetical protein
VSVNVNSLLGSTAWVGPFLVTSITTTGGAGEKPGVCRQAGNHIQ